jgi:DNA-directed RNA polymerase specialized sigma24 family protein
VLVDGLTQADAARAVGLPPNAVHNAIARCRRGLELAEAVTRPAATD